MTDEWVPLSMREGRKAIPALSEKFSPGATRSLVYWLGLVLRPHGMADTAGVLHIGMVCDIDLDTVNTFNTSLVDQLLNSAARSDSLMVDVLDATLHRSSVTTHLADRLRATLLDARSVWTLTSDGKGITRRAERAAVQAFEQVTAQQDEAAIELTEAWSRAYDRDANASDAWDHAIKAVEAALIPLVVPKKEKANLGSVLGQWKGNAEGWRFGSDGDIASVEKVLRLMWPNPDRHPGSERRTPTIEEARGMVHLAVTVVQWVRDGLIAK